MEKDKAIQIAQAVKAGTAHVFISEKSVGEAMDEAIYAMDKISRIEDLVEGRLTTSTEMTLSTCCTK